MMRPEKTGPWMPAEIRKAAAIWQRDYADHYGEYGPWGKQSETFATIAKALNRSVDGVARRYTHFGAGFTAGPRGGAVSQQAVDDLERRRAAAARQDLTASIFGDPPPGYSALDKRGQGVRP